MRCRSAQESKNHYLSKSTTSFGQKERSTSITAEISPNQALTSRLLMPPIELCSQNQTIPSLSKEPPTISKFITTVPSTTSSQYLPKPFIAPSSIRPSYWSFILLPSLFGTSARINACSRWRENGQLAGLLQRRPSWQSKTNQAYLISVLIKKDASSSDRLEGISSKTKQFQHCTLLSSKGLLLTS